MVQHVRMVGAHLEGLVRRQPWAPLAGAAAVLWLSRWAWPLHSPWFDLCLAATAFLGAVRIHSRGLEPLVLYLRPAPETIPALLGSFAFLVTFSSTLLYALGRLAAGSVSPSHDMVLMAEDAVAIFVAALAASTLDARPAQGVAPAPSGSARPPAADIALVLHAAGVLAAGALVGLLWHLSGGGWATAAAAAVASALVLDPFSPRIASKWFRGSAVLETPGGAGLLGTVIAPPDEVFVEAGVMLTTRRPRVVEVRCLSSAHTGEDILQLAVSAFCGLHDPVSQAIVGETLPHGATIRRAHAAELVPGRGVRAILSGRRLLCGRLGLFEKEGWSRPALDALRDAAREPLGRGDFVVFVGVGVEPLGVIVLADELRPDALKAVASLRGLGWPPGVLETPSLADGPPLERRVHGVGPVVRGDAEERAARIRERVAAGRSVAVIATRDENAAALRAATVPLECPANRGRDGAGGEDLSGACVSLLEAVGRARRGRWNVFGAVVAAQVALVPVVAGATAPVTGIPASPVLAALAFYALRRVAFRIQAKGL